MTRVDSSNIASASFTGSSCSAHGKLDDFVSDVSHIVNHAVVCPEIFSNWEILYVDQTC